MCLCTCLSILVRTNSGQLPCIVRTFVEFRTFVVGTTCNLVFIMEITFLNRNFEGAFRKKKEKTSVRQFLQLDLLTSHKHCVQTLFVVHWTYAPPHFQPITEQLLTHFILFLIRTLNCLLFKILTSYCFLKHIILFSRVQVDFSLFTAWLKKNIYIFKCISFLAELFLPEFYGFMKTVFPIQDSQQASREGMKLCEAKAG